MQLMTILKCFLFHKITLVEKKTTELQNKNISTTKKTTEHQKKPGERLNIYGHVRKYTKHVNT